jgi:hypothetical protein
MDNENNKDNRTFFEKGLHWPVAIVLMFVFSATLILTTGVMGARKGSHAVEPDYYARSLDWDSEKKMLNTADRLGWDVRISASPVLDPIGSRLVSIMILDKDQTPIEDSLVEIICFAQSNARDTFTNILQHAGAGQYQSRIQGMHTTGLWEYRISIRHAGEQALVIKSIELEG